MAEYLEGEDPCDAVQRLGADGFRELIDNAIPLLEFVLWREAERWLSEES